MANFMEPPMVLFREKLMKTLDSQKFLNIVKLNGTRHLTYNTDCSREKVVLISKQHRNEVPCKIILVGVKNLSTII